MVWTKKRKEMEMIGLDWSLGGLGTDKLDKKVEILTKNSNIVSHINLNNYMITHYHG